MVEYLAAESIVSGSDPASSIESRDYAETLEPQSLVPRQRKVFRLGATDTGTICASISEKDQRQILESAEQSVSGQSYATILVMIQSSGLYGGPPFSVIDIAVEESTPVPTDELVATSGRALSLTQAKEVSAARDIIESHREVLRRLG